MHFAAICLVVGLLLVLMALSSSVLRRLPLSTSMIYLTVGVALGPLGAGLIDLDLQRDTHLLERLAEIAVLLSLFTAGLKLRTRLSDRRWRLALRLASVSMVITVGCVAAVAHLGLGLPIGAAVLLGAVLAPTDPVLASDVQVEHAGDADELRFSLTGEAGLNDGTAFPFVMLGLGLLGAHSLGTFGWRWVLVDLLWAIAAGLAVGALTGYAVGRLVIYLRRHHQEAIGLEEFLTLGLIAIAYGTAVLLHAYGFLAVFMAGYALRRIELLQSPESHPEEGLETLGAKDLATHPDRAPAYMTKLVLEFNEQLERIAEVALVVVLGALLRIEHLSLSALWFIPFLLFVLRPLSVALGLFKARTTATHKTLMGWFGVRGIGSIYYLCFALGRGLPEPIVHTLGSLTVLTIATSILLHGISVTPLMRLYSSRVRSESRFPAHSS